MRTILFTIIILLAVMAEMAGIEAGQIIDEDPVLKVVRENPNECIGLNPSK